MQQEQEILDKKYRERIKTLTYIRVPRFYRYGPRIKRFTNFTFNIKHKYLVAQSGFFYGGMSGAALGVVFGIIPAFKHKQPSILIASMAISGGMFSCIGGFGSMLHSA